jgi:hypothetical protein
MLHEAGPMGFETGCAACAQVLVWSVSL